MVVVVVVVVVDIVNVVIIDGIVVVVLFDLFHENACCPTGRICCVLVWGQKFQCKILILVLFLLRNRNLLCPGLGTEISV
jgi:hypothetical protein